MDKVCMELWVNGLRGVGKHSFPLSTSLEDQLHMGVSESTGTGSGTMDSHLSFCDTIVS